MKSPGPRAALEPVYRIYVESVLPCEERKVDYNTDVRLSLTYMGKCQSTVERLAQTYRSIAWKIGTPVSNRPSTPSRQ